MRIYDHAARIRLARGSRILSDSQILITDRLHGHILASLMGIPHIVLDNSYGKIAPFRAAWQGRYDNGLCRTAESIDEAADIAASWLKERD